MVPKKSKKLYSEPDVFAPPVEEAVDVPGVIEAAPAADTAVELDEAADATAVEDSTNDEPAEESVELEQSFDALALFNPSSSEVATLDEAPKTRVVPIVIGGIAVLAIAVAALLAVPVLVAGTRPAPSASETPQDTAVVVDTIDGDVRAAAAAQVSAASAFSAEASPRIAVVDLDAATAAMQSALDSDSASSLADASGAFSDSVNAVGAAVLALADRAVTDFPNADAGVVAALSSAVAGYSPTGAVPAAGWVSAVFAAIDAVQVSHDANTSVVVVETPAPTPSPEPVDTTYPGMFGGSNVPPIGG